MFGSMKRALFATAAVAAGGAMIAAGAAAPTAEVGKPAPDFTLVDMDGKEHSLSSYTAQGKVVVLEWFSYECPFVKKHYNSDKDTMNSLVTAWEGQPVVWLRVNSHDPQSPVGNADKVREAIESWDITTPMLVDADGAVGKSYGAKRTPEMYVISADGVLVYHGAIDDDRTARGPGAKNYVEQAVTQTLAGEAVTTPTTEAYGCSIKYAR